MKNKIKKKNAKIKPKYFLLLIFFLKNRIHLHFQTDYALDQYYKSQTSITVLVKKLASQDAITPNDCFGCSVICIDWSYNIANYPTAFKNNEQGKKWLTGRTFLGDREVQRRSISPDSNTKKL